MVTPWASKGAVATVKGTGPLQVASRWVNGSELASNKRNPYVGGGVRFANKGGPIVDPKRISFAKGGPVQAPGRSFAKTADEFTGGRMPTKQSVPVRQDYGDKGAPAKRTGDKSEAPVKPRK